MELLAHTGQTLKEHLENVAAMAATFAAPFGMSRCAYLCGLVHDLGKSSDSFQRHLAGERTTANYHKDAGFNLLWDAGLPYLAMAIDGHHGGLTKFDRWSYVSGGRGGQVPTSKSVEDVLGYSVDGAIEAARKEWDAHVKRWSRLRRETGGDGTIDFEASLAIRMLFSCLVDADFIDTERACLGDEVCREPLRGGDDLIARYDAYMTRLSSSGSGPVFEGRRRLNEALREAGRESRGMRRLQADTGFGKTLASLGFSLESMQANGLRRVVYSIPFNTISDQTYGVFKDVLGDERVLEATSSFAVEDNEDESRETLVRKALLTQNWDSPVVVTSNVQLLESLFSNGVSSCRKLHNVVGSVLVFDEVQAFDESLAMPTLAALELLVRDYGCDVLMMSATCPDFSGMLTFGTDIRDVEWDDGSAHKVAFGRVKYEMLGTVNVDGLLGHVDESSQTLFVMNTRRQARMLFEHVRARCKSGALDMPEDSVMFLSNDLCQVTRASVIGRVKRMLDAGEPCVVVSTTLVEAGVDLDFRDVFRCMGGVDGILQAAGRSNREGRRSFGQVYVFDFDESDEMSDSRWELMRNRKKSTRQSILACERAGLGCGESKFWDLASQCCLEWRYGRHTGRRGWKSDFAGLLGSDVSVGGICLDGWNFIAWSNGYKLVRDAGVSVFVPVDENGVELFRALSQGRAVSSRRLWHYCVNVFERDVRSLSDRGVLVDCGGVLCVGPESVDTVYDCVLGLRCE